MRFVRAGHIFINLDTVPMIGIGTDVQNDQTTYKIGIHVPGAVILTGNYQTEEEAAQAVQSVLHGKSDTLPPADGIVTAPSRVQPSSDIAPVQLRVQR